MFVSWALRLGGAVNELVTPHPSPAGTPNPIVSAVLKGRPLLSVRLANVMLIEPAVDTVKE